MKTKIWNTDNILRFTLVLFLVNLAAASILATVYNIAKPRIEAQKNLLERDALRQVMPESVGDRFEGVHEDGEIKYWKVFKGSGHKPAGYVFIAKRYGYSSVIETMVGIKKDAAITGVKILSHNETPGLGAKLVEVVSDKTVIRAFREMFSKEKKAVEKPLPYFTEQFRGLDLREIGLSKHGIQAITGATISSRAVVDSIKSRGLEILNVK